MERKNTTFQTLKPTCVALSQASLGLNVTRVDSRAVEEQLKVLKDALETIVSGSNALDAKIAEYVFFPISQVLKSSQRVSIRVLELSLQCITLLVEKGWQQQIPAQLAGQLVIFCTMLAEKHPKNLAFAEATDELQSSALRCLHQLFVVVGKDSEVSTLLRNEANFPQLGQTISTTLEAIERGDSAEVQIAATDTFRALLSSVLDVEMQANFLPGIVSKLTKILTPSTKTRRSHLVLSSCLDALSTILRNTMADVRQSQRVNGSDGFTVQDGAERSESLISQAWQEQAALQLKAALTKVTSLKAHSRIDVQTAVRDLCSKILQYCRGTLKNCLQLAVETLISIASSEFTATSAVELESLAMSHSSISGLVQDILYDWLRTITTIMQGSDEQKKASRMRQINIAYELLVKAGVDTTTIDRLLATTLRDIVIVTLDTTATKHRPKALAGPLVSIDLVARSGNESVTEFDSPLIRIRGQEPVLTSVEQTARLIGPLTSGSDFASDLARQLRLSQDEDQIANFWLLLTATQAGLQSKDAVDDLLDFGSAPDANYKQYVEEMYSLSLNILSGSSEHAPDPRLQALALRALALRAQTSGHDFRYDLVDALYPVLHTLATPDEHLQRDSIVALNAFKSACGYVSVEDLIVENVDYLTNAVALKLNAFDVSPQAPQVLLMMVRLAGPSLLPYLEDTVESIFAALEDYHGYPLLVELLFKVLGVIADEGVKNPQLAITNGDTGDLSSILVERWRPTSVASLAEMLEYNAKEEQERSEIANEAHESHPKRPWTDLNEVHEDVEETDETTHGQRTGTDVSEPAPPVPKTYNLLFKITDLTQHFLPSASPSLRASLLSLIRTTVPAIAQHENSFLPLINTLWPEVVSRLDDEEDYVIANALEVMKILCEYAHDFMRTRIVQLWPRLEEIQASVSSDSRQSISRRYAHEAPLAKHDSMLFNDDSFGAADGHPVAKVASSPYENTSVQLLRNSLIACLTAMVRFVQLTPEMIDGALMMLQPNLQQEDVRLAFAEENSDASWLVQVRTHSINLPEIPRIPNNLPWRFAKAPS